MSFEYFENESVIRQKKRKRPVLCAFTIPCGWCSVYFTSIMPVDYPISPLCAKCYKHGIIYDSYKENKEDDTNKINFKLKTLDHPYFDIVISDSFEGESL